MPVTAGWRCCRCPATGTAEGLSKATAQDRAYDRLWSHYMDKHRSEESKTR